MNDKFRHFKQVYGTFGLRTIRATGDSTVDDILPLMRGQYDICLMIYEKFAALLLGSPHIVDQVGAVVIDEVQMIADESRGVNLEFVLTLLLHRRQQGAEPQLIALSAVIGDTNGLERWLGARLLRGQGVPAGILHALQSSASQENPSTLRAKKAVACLLWITDKLLSEIEKILGGTLDGAAGPIRSVQARTCDLLPVAARVAEILH